MRKASVPPNAAAVDRARRLNFMVVLCRCRLAAGEHHLVDVQRHRASEQEMQKIR